MHNFKELTVWQKARELNRGVYLLTKQFPSHEKYGITLQIRRSCVSIASNIAEGSGRSGDREFLQFLHIANGSLFELETQIMLALDLGYITEKEFSDTTLFVKDIGKMLYGLIRRYKH